MWLKINNEWGEYKWLCADSGIEITKTGCTIHGKGNSLHYLDDSGQKHIVLLTNIETKQVIDPITNKKFKV